MSPKPPALLCTRLLGNPSWCVSRRSLAQRWAHRRHPQQLLQVRHPTPSEFMDSYWGGWNIIHVISYILLGLLHVYLIKPNISKTDITMKHQPSVFEGVADDPFCCCTSGRYHPRCSLALIMYHTVMVYIDICSPVICDEWNPYIFFFLQVHLRHRNPT